MGEGREYTWCGMKRNPMHFALAGLDIGRFFTLMAVAIWVTGASTVDGTAQVTRALASTALVLPFMLFLLWLDPVRYAAFRTAVLAGKAIALFSSALAIPALLLSGPAFSETRLSAAFAVIVVCYDLASLLAMALSVPRDRSVPAGGCAASPAAPAEGRPGEIENVTVP